MLLTLFKIQEVCKALSSSPVQLVNWHSKLVSNVLSYVSQTTSSVSRGGVGRSLGGGTRRFPVSGPVGQGVGSYLEPSSTSSSIVPIAVLRRSRLRLDDDEADGGLLNVAPLSTVSCSHPSAQPADVLLQPSAPHRRARSPSWSHHFYPAEQYIELTITLPCPVLLREIQLHPHLTSLASQCHLLLLLY